MRQCTLSHAELGGEAVWVGDTSVTHAEFRGLPRKVVLIWQRGGRCGENNTLTVSDQVPQQLYFALGAP